MTAALRKDANNVCVAVPAENGTLDNDEEDGEGFSFSISAHRKLMNVSFDPRLAYLPERALVHHANMWQYQLDHGYSTYLNVTTAPGDLKLPHTVRQSAILQHIGHSPKLAALAFHLLRDCLESGRKIIVFTRWPITQWASELLAKLVGLPFLSLRSCHGMAFREESIKEFNRVGSKFRVLFISAE